MSELLHHTSYGDHGSRIAFCHGLFGQGRNFTQIAKSVATDHRVTLLDMPNHGRSAWTDSFSYRDVADSVAETLHALGGQDRWAIVGHSMGGKIAMLLALQHRDLVERLVVVDVSPVDYHGITSFNPYIDAMTGLDLAATTTRAQADLAMRDQVPDDTVRAFLLSNLRRERDGWRWQMNLDLLARSLRELGGWPTVQDGTSYDGPVLWIAGGTSSYIKPEYADVMRALFPRVRLLTVKNAGHWVHSQQPEIFTEAVRRFVDG